MKPPTQKSIATAVGITSRHVGRVYAGEQQNYAVIFETAKQCGKASLAYIDCIMDAMLTDGLQDNTVTAFASVHKVSQQEARELLGFLCELQDSKVQDMHVSIACTRRLGVHAIIEIDGLLIQAVANGLDLTIHIGHLPFKGSIEQCVSILTALLRGINN